jgi:hypothetical protein
MTGSIKVTLPTAEPIKIAVTVPGKHRDASGDVV